MSAVRSFQMLDARVLTMLRSRALTRYQIQELLGDVRPPVSDGALNKLLDTLDTRNLILREGLVRYRLTKRGEAAVMLIDQARNARRMEPDDNSSAPDVNRISDIDKQLMMRGRASSHSSDADRRPAPPRRGSLRFLLAPSRYGDQLHYRDGRITDMAGRRLFDLEHRRAEALGLVRGVDVVDADLPF